MKLNQSTPIMFSVLFSIFYLGCQSQLPIPHQSNSSAELSEFDYLLEIQSEKVDQFKATENSKSLSRLKNDPLFKKIETEILNIVTAKDKLPKIFILDKMVYQLWQDQKQVKGQLKRISMTDFENRKSNWEVVLDLDLLSKKENKNWVYKNIECYNLKSEYCLIHLSDGGQDATQVREFNLKTKSFISDGFYFSESKSSFTWVDENTLLVADATKDSGQLTESGYPKILRLLKRNSSLSKAEIIDQVNKETILISAFSVLDLNKNYFFLNYALTTHENEYFYIPDVAQPQFKTKLPIPNDAEFVGVFRGQVLFQVKSEFISKNIKANSGTLIAFSLSEASQKNVNYNIVKESTKNEIIKSVSITKNQIILETLKDVKGQFYFYDFIENQWVPQILPQGLEKLADGHMTTIAADSEILDFYFSYTDFLTPTQYYKFNSYKNKIELFMSSPKRFDAKGLVSEQFFATSKDGTKVPYFIIRPKNLKFDGQNPTYQYGYGGFEYPLTPNYLATLGKSWLNRGGVYVIANIRGGGEYGPEWHKAALKLNRQKAFDDFIAVSEDLIQRKITSPKHLGIGGGSNGGLLMSVMLTQRPDLFNAIVCEVPLANMLVFHKLLAGASWVAEYGSPEKTEERKYLRSYSPVHNLKKNIQYPEAFFVTSTKDDRVHPGHARQMVARLKSLDQNVLYYENPEGGHGRSANLNEYSTIIALELTYLFQKLK